MFFSFIIIFLNIPYILFFKEKKKMGSVFGKDSSPLITFSCINIRNSDNVNMDRVDGIEEEKEREKENIFLCFRREKKRKKWQKRRKRNMKLNDEEIEELVSLYEERKKKKSN